MPANSRWVNSGFKGLNVKLRARRLTLRLCRCSRRNCMFRHHQGERCPQGLCMQCHEQTWIRLFMFDNFTRNSTAIKIVTVEAFPVLMRHEIIIILYSWQRHVLAPTVDWQQEHSLLQSILTRRSAVQPGFHTYSVKAGGSLKTNINPQGMFLLEADSRSAVSEIPVFYGLVIVMAHKTSPFKRNTSLLH